MNRYPSQRLLCAFFLLLAAGQIKAQPVVGTKQGQAKVFTITARVDTRVELMSIVARLAGYEEYVRDDFKSYAKEVDEHFRRYRQHQAIQFAMKIRESNNIAFDAVMGMAVHLNPPPALTPRVPFTERVPDTRWGQNTAEVFLKLLRDFYREADCERFFLAHADLYSTAERRFEHLLSKVDFDWYRRFYGEQPSGSFNLYIGLLNGGGNYGPKVVYPDGKEDLFAIIGTWQVDSAGLPVYSDETLPTIIHEYNHSFINHLVYDFDQQLKSPGEKVFAPVAEKMKILAYGSWQVGILESIVRAAVLRYRFEHEGQRIAYTAMIAERNRGFLWIEDLFTLLGMYENSRTVHPTMRTFFPLLVGYFNDLSNRIEFVAKRFEELRPRVVAMSPFTNGTQDVDPSTRQLTFTFDKPLDPGAGYSINRGPGGSAHYPVENVIGFDKTGSIVTVQVKLSADSEYEFVLTGSRFRTKDDYPLQPYTVQFKTKKQ